MSINVTAKYTSEILTLAAAKPLSASGIEDYTILISIIRPYAAKHPNASKRPVLTRSTRTAIIGTLSISYLHP
jgi:hypothetical protein